MPKFSVQVPHDRSKEEAIERLNKFVDMLKAKYQEKASDLGQSWDGDKLNFQFKTFGIPLKGSILVGDDALDVDGDLPFSAMMFKGRIESSIKEELDKLMKMGD